MSSQFQRKLLRAKSPALAVWTEDLKSPPNAPPTEIPSSFSHPRCPTSAVAVLLVYFSGAETGHIPGNIRVHDFRRATGLYEETSLHHMSRTATNKYTTPKLQTSYSFSSLYWMPIFQCIGRVCAIA